MCPRFLTDGIAVISLANGKRQTTEETTASLPAGHFTAARHAGRFSDFSLGVAKIPKILLKLKLFWPLGIGMVG